MLCSRKPDGAFKGQIRRVHGRVPPQPRFAACHVSPHPSQVFPSNRSPSRDRVHSTCLTGCVPARGQPERVARGGDGTLYSVEMEQTDIPQMNGPMLAWIVV